MKDKFFPAQWEVISCAGTQPTSFSLLPSTSRKKSFLDGLFFFLHALGEGMIGGHLSSGVVVKPQTAE